MKKHLFLFALALLILVSCTPAQGPTEEPLVANTPISESDESDTGDIYGTWIRQAVYMNGALENTKQATLKINTDDSYTSGTDVCTTSGSVQAVDETATLTMTQSNCPGNLPLPYAATYVYKISEDGETMSWTTANMREDYARAE